MSSLFPLALTVLAATSKKSTSSSGGATFLIFIVVIVAALYFLFLRPQQQRARQQREQMQTVNVGDELLTAGGIVGRVVEAREDRVVIVSDEDHADGARLVVMRSAISRKLVPASQTHDEYETDGYTDDDHDADEHESSGGSHDDEPEEETGT